MEDISGVVLKLKDWQKVDMERLRGTALKAQGMACTEALGQREFGASKEWREPGVQGRAGEERRTAGRALWACVCVFFKE